MVIETRAVAASAYGARKIDSTLTHSVVTENGVERVLCNRVTLANLLDDTFATDSKALPTCKACRAKLDRL